MRPVELSSGLTHSGSTSRSCFGRRCTVTSSGSHPRTTSRRGNGSRSAPPSQLSRASLTGAPPRTGRIGPMQRGEIWFAATPGGDRPVLVLTRDPVADRIGFVVVAAHTRTKRGLVSELDLTPADDGV